MDFKVFHIQGLPIDPEHRKLAQTEWKAYAAEILTVKPDVDDTAAWTNLNNLLNTKEDELRGKYPSEALWSFDTLEQLVERIKEEGSISLCEENGIISLYIMSKYEK